MYRAKEDGRARYEVFDARMRTGAVRRLEIDNDLHRALERDEFVLHYQPQIDLRTHSLVGVEALLRWEHPERGLVPPMDFIPVAEETGLIIELGRWVLQAACRQGRQWLDRFPASADFTMSVNLSARQLAQPRLAEEVAAALEESGFPAENLVLEITETVLMNDTTVTIATLRRAQAARRPPGHRRLRHRLLVADLPAALPDRHPQDRQVLRRRARRGERRGVGGGPARSCRWPRRCGWRPSPRASSAASTCASCRRLQCDIAQGFFFARPLDARSLEALMEQPDSPAALGPAAAGAH